MNRIFLGIGGNLGDRIANIQNAVSLLEQKFGAAKKVSSVYLSEPWGFTHAKYFTNIVAEFETNFSSEEVLDVCLSTENQLKRKRSGCGYEGRTMDIDLLYFNSEIINTQRLVIPHPRMNDRLFVLLPMCEIAEDWICPVTGKSIRELVDECKDISKIRKVASKVQIKKIGNIN